MISLMDCEMITIVSLVNIYPKLFISGGGGDFFSLFSFLSFSLFLRQRRETLCSRVSCRAETTEYKNVLRGDQAGMR